MKEKLLLEKPTLTNEINAQIVSLGKIEDNILEVKQYALDLKDYYQKLVFTPETMKEAKDEKAEVNKMKDRVAKFRKEIISEYKKPIETFENEAKETEKILNQTYETINNQVSNYESELKGEIENKLDSYFEEYRTFKGIDKEYISFQDLGIKITLGYATEKGELTKKAKEEVASKLDDFANNLDTIATMQYSDEILVEFIKMKDLSKSIKSVNDRHLVLGKIQEKTEVKKEQKINDEAMIEKIDKLSAPKVNEEIYQTTFKVYATLENLKLLKQFMEERGIKYE